MERTYRNLGYVLLVLLPVFIAGFWVPYFSRIRHFDASITAAVHVHAVLLFSFLLLLMLLSLIALDKGRHAPARPYIALLFAYVAIEAFWFSLGRPV